MTAHKIPKNIKTLPTRFDQVFNIYISYIDLSLEFIECDDTRNVVNVNLAIMDDDDFITRTSKIKCQNAYIHESHQYRLILLKI